MTKLEKKIKLEVLKVKIAYHTKMISDYIWQRTDSAHMHDIYVNRLNEYKEEYLELLRDILVPNKTYVMDMGNSIMLYDEDNNIIPFLYKNMTFGQLKNEHDDYLFDDSTPFEIHKYCDAGEGTMEENRAEIVECLHLSEWEFNVNPNGVTIITGRPYNWDDESVYVIVNKNIFDTDLIMNISLASI